MKILFLLSAFLFFLACLVAVLVRDGRQLCEKVNFLSPGRHSSPIKISGLLLRPRNRASRRLPGVVFCHGLTANKEIYLGLCRKIVSLGVAVLAIDLRGHGHSGGASDFGRSEHLDVRAAVNMLVERDDIDPDRVAVVGHSLGGITVTRACFLETESPCRIRGAIAIYCWQSMREAVEAVFGPIRTFVERWWPLFGWSRQFSITDGEELDQRSVIEHLRPGVPVSYLLIVGSGDPLTDMTRSAEIVARASGRSEVEPDVVYGCFADGLARKFVIVSGADHVNVLSKRETFVAIREWLEKSLSLPKPEFVAGAPSARLRSAVRIATTLLFAMSVLACAGWVMNLWPPSAVSQGHNVPALKMLAAGVGAFLLCSFLAIPLTRALGLRPFVPHWGSDILSLLMASRAMLFVPALVAWMVWRPGFEGSWLDLLGLSPRHAFSGIAIAGMLFAWIVMSWNALARTNRLPTFWPVVGMRTFLLLFAVVLLSYLAEESVFRGMIQARLAGVHTAGEVLFSAILYAVTASVALVGLLWPLFPSPLYAARFRSVSIPLLPVLFVCALMVFAIHGLLAAILFHFTHTILAPALFLALLVSFLFSGSIGVRTF